MVEPFCSVNAKKWVESSFGLTSKIGGFPTVKRFAVYREIAVNQTGNRPFDWASDHHVRGSVSRPAEVTPLLHSPLLTSRGGSEPWRLSSAQTLIFYGQMPGRHGNSWQNESSRPTLPRPWDDRVLERTWSMRRWGTAVHAGPFNLWHFRGRWASLAVLEKWSLVLRELIRRWASEFIKWWCLRLLSVKIRWSRTMQCVGNWAINPSANV